MKKTETKKIRKLDRVEKAIVQCHFICEENGVTLFSIGIGDRNTYQTYRRKESWRKRCERLGKEGK